MQTKQCVYRAELQGVLGIELWKGRGRTRRNAREKMREGWRMKRTAAQTKSFPQFKSRPLPLRERREPRNFPSRLTFGGRRQF